MAQLEEASDPRSTPAHAFVFEDLTQYILDSRPPPPPPPIGITSTLSNPFTDSHEVSSLADVDVGNLSEVEMSIFQSEAGGGQFVILVVASVMNLNMFSEAAVIFDLHGRDASTQQVVATFSPQFVVGDGVHPISQ